MSTFSALSDSLLSSSPQEASYSRPLSEQLRCDTPLQNYIGFLTITVYLTFQLLRYVGRADYWVFSFEIIFCCFVIYYMVEEVMEIRKVKLDYFNSAWNIMDLIVILISLFNILMAVYTELVVTDLLKVYFNFLYLDPFPLISLL